MRDMQKLRAFWVVDPNRQGWGWIGYRYRSSGPYEFMGPYIPVQIEPDDGGAGEPSRPAGQLIGNTVYNHQKQTVKFERAKPDAAERAARRIFDESNMTGSYDDWLPKVAAIIREEMSK